MFCTNCGNKANEESNFCKNCGEPIREISPSPNQAGSEPLQSENGSENSKYKGLSGWLTIVILGLFITAGRMGYEFITIFNDSVDYSGMKGWFIYDIATLGSLTALAIYLIYLFYEKDKSFPGLYLFLLVAIVVVNIITILALSSYNLEEEALYEYYDNMGKSILGLLIWGSYILNSKRVKATFIE